jgi:hypothetical protein
MDYRQTRTFHGGSIHVRVRHLSTSSNFVQFGDDERQSEASYSHSLIEGARTELPLHIGAVDPALQLWDFRPAIPNNSTHFEGGKHPMETYLTGSDQPFSLGYNHGGDLPGTNLSATLTGIGSFSNTNMNVSEDQTTSDSGYKTGENFMGLLGHSSMNFSSGPLQPLQKGKVGHRVRGEAIKCPHPNCDKISLCRSDFQ